MKITFKTLDGRTLNKEFIDANDFIRQQNLEIPAIDDSAKVEIGRASCRERV